MGTLDATHARAEAADPPRRPAALLLTADPFVRAQLGANLAADGWDVQLADATWQALGALTRGIPALAVLDLSGPERLTPLVAHCVAPDMPLVALVDAAQEGDEELSSLADRRRARAAIITKPFTYPELKSAAASLSPGSRRRAGADTRVTR